MQLQLVLNLLHFAYVSYKQYYTSFHLVSASCSLPTFTTVCLSRFSKILHSSFIVFYWNSILQLSAAFFVNFLVPLQKVTKIAYYIAVSI